MNRERRKQIQEVLAHLQDFKREFDRIGLTEDLKGDVVEIKEAEEEYAESLSDGDRRGDAQERVEALEIAADSIEFIEDKLSDIAEKIDDALTALEDAAQ
jgi:hypothetical protein